MTICSPGALKMYQKPSEKLVYSFHKFSSVDDMLVSSDLEQKKCRVDIYLEVNEKLSSAVVDLIRTKCPEATISENYVLERLNNSMIAVEFIKNE